MEKRFWDSRYAENETVYGQTPNLFFKRFIDSHKAGSILLPAEGEGRNAVYAATKGWKVNAFDFSEVAKEKAVQLAKRNNVSIHYTTQDIRDFKAHDTYDVVALIYVHLLPALRDSFHKEVYKSIRSGGFLVFEAFAKEQLEYKTGGPKDPNMLYDAPTICNDFQYLHLLSCGQKEVELNEGPFHKGKAAVLQMIGQKL